MKRVLSALLALALMLTLAPLFPSVEAASGSKLVALTFDDGPGYYTEDLLEGLRERGVHATFCMLGQSAENWPEVVEQVYQDGHQLANHSYSHPNFYEMSIEEVKEQIYSTNAILDRTAGEGTMYMVRAPYGNSNPEMRLAVGQPFLFWSVDTEDWNRGDESSAEWQNIVRDRIVDGVVNGSAGGDGEIVLCHDVHGTTIPAALAAIDILQDKGYEFVTMNEMIRRRGQEVDITDIYYSCKVHDDVDLGPVIKPTAKLAYDGDQVKVTLLAQEGADIYYSLENSRINGESTRYTEPFTVDAGQTLWAVAAFDLNGDRSITIEVKTEGDSQPTDPTEPEPTEPEPTEPTETAPQPDMDIQDGTLYLEGEDGLDLHYLLKGEQAANEVYDYYGPVDLDCGTEVRAWASGEGYLDSPLTVGTYSHNGNFFRDVRMESWYYEAMDQAVTAGYLNGMGKNFYAPQKDVTRAQIVTMLYRLADKPAFESTELPFFDTDPDEYYNEPLLWAWENDIIHGYPNGSFSPNDPVSRQELCKILSLYMKTLGYELEAGTGSADGYTDYDKIGEWALPYVEQVTESGLLKGNANGTFAPRDLAIRAQAATILIRVAEMLG